MADKSSSKANGIGFGGLLTVLFIGLKLTHYIDWEWKFVLAPLWVPFALFLVVSLVALVAFVVHGVFKE
jgi:hypothetical protein